MRICIINEFFYPDNTGGTGTVLSELARTLQNDPKKISIDVITSNNLYRQSAGTLSPQEDWDGVHIYRLKTPKPNGLSTFLRLISNLAFSFLALLKLFTLGRYDVLLVGTAPPMVAWATHIYKCLTGTPYVYIVYDLEPDRSVTLNVFSSQHPVIRLFRSGQRRWLHAASKVVVLGRCMRDYLSNAYSLSPQKVAVIPIGSDPDEIPMLDRQSHFRERNGLRGFIVLYSGNYGRYHNFDTILDAAKSLLDQPEEIQFVLVGGGAQEQHIADRIKFEKIHNVRMFKFAPREEYADLLASADVSLVTLEPGMEGLCVPSKFYSILASGRATVAMVSPSSEVARVIEEAECGIRIDAGDTTRLVETLTLLARDASLTSQMGLNARRVLEGRYSTACIASQYYTTFREVLGVEEAATSPMVHSSQFHFTKPQDSTVIDAKGKSVQGRVQKVSEPLLPVREVDPEDAVSRT